MEYYRYVFTMLGIDGVTINGSFVNKTTTDPNIYLNAGANVNNCYLNVTFFYEVASFRNRMGLFKFTGTSPNRVANSQQLLFQEDVIDNGCLPSGSTLTVGEHSCF